jgi:hypothetical protein
VKNPKLRAGITTFLLAMGTVAHITAANKGLSQTADQQVELNKGAAAVRYLKAACAVNKAVSKERQATERMKTANEELKSAMKRWSSEKSEASSKLLGDATNKAAKLLDNYKQARSEVASSHREMAKELLDPLYIWPDEVRDEIKVAAATSLEIATQIKDSLNNSTKVNPPNGIGMAYSTIRAKLNLNERGVDCH